MINWKEVTEKIKNDPCFIEYHGREELWSMIEAFFRNLPTGDYSFLGRRQHVFRRKYDMYVSHQKWIIMWFHKYGLSEQVEDKESLDNMQWMLENKEHILDHLKVKCK